VFVRTPLQLPYLETECNDDKQDGGERHSKTAAPEAQLGGRGFRSLIYIFKCR